MHYCGNLAHDIPVWIATAFPFGYAAYLWMKSKLGTIKLKLFPKRCQGSCHGCPCKRKDDE